MAHLPLLGIEAEKILGLFFVANAKVVVAVRGGTIQRGGTLTLRLRVRIVLFERKFMDGAPNVRKVGRARGEQLALHQSCSECNACKYRQRACEREHAVLGR